MVNVKEEARRLIECLPDAITWDDLMHEIYVRQAIEAGLADSRAGRLTSAEEVRDGGEERDTLEAGGN